MRRIGLALAALLHRFSEPVELVSATIGKPAPSGGRARQSNGYPTTNGYTYLVRTDGNSFLPGRYTVKLKARRAAGQPFKYKGTVAAARLGQFAPPLPPAAMPPEVTGSTGAVVFVER